MGCIAAAQLNIPIVHIEGCMRSYDWRMPEEKYRTVSDHLSDLIYAYLDEYRQQSIAEGLNPRNIVVTGNPIVDVLEHTYFSRTQRFEALATNGFFTSRGIRRGDFYLMTCHRRENVGDSASLERILRLVTAMRKPVFFPASYRTQHEMKTHGLDIPPNAILVEPVGYEELLVLLTNSLGVLTDSGTIVEEACILGVPSIQMRRSTERPQVYDVGASVKFDPSAPASDRPQDVIARFDALRGRSWRHPFGDGRASQRIVADLLSRLENARIAGHRPEDYHLDVSRSYRADGAA
ncbi:MAG TPA: UDP-N-acetylglucosamine 2-epimerase [Bryobacteraceae bacterium]|nr:UDP-N-acetylglucosamine 2-epimerase [Bryobacteraceae bacterium]